jgi:hypothetical protein
MFTVTSSSSISIVHKYIKSLFEIVLKNNVFNTPFISTYIIVVVKYYR